MSLDEVIGLAPRLRVCRFRCCTVRTVCMYICTEGQTPTGIIHIPIPRIATLKESSHSLPYTSIRSSYGTIWIVLRHITFISIFSYWDRKGVLPTSSFLFSFASIEWVLIKEPGYGGMTTNDYGWILPYPRYKEYCKPVTAALLLESAFAFDFWYLCHAWLTCR